MFLYIVLNIQIPIAVWHWKPSNKRYGKWGGAQWGRLNNFVQTTSYDTKPFKHTN